MIQCGYVVCARARVRVGGGGAKEEARLKTGKMWEKQRVASAGASRSSATNLHACLTQHVAKPPGQALLCRGEECVCLSRGTSAASAAHAVDVVLNGEGERKVDNKS